MKEEHLWPLVGVGIGWLLAALASGWQSREATRRSIGRLLMRLLQIHRQVRTLNAVSELFKDNVESWAEYESFRKSITDRHFLEPSADFDALKASIDEISGVYLVESLHLRGLVEILSKAKVAKFSGSVKVRELYIRFLSAHEVGLAGCERELQKRIFRLSLKHSAVTAVRVFLTLRSSTSKSNAAFLKKFMADSFQSMHAKAQQGAQADTPASGEPAA